MCCCPPALYVLLTHADQPPALYMCHSSFLPSPFARSCPLPRTVRPAPLYTPFNARQTRHTPTAPTLTLHQTSSSVCTHAWHAGRCADAACRPLHEDPTVAHVLVPGAPSTCPCPHPLTHGGQIVATVVAGTVQLGMQEWMLMHIPDMCSPHQNEGCVPRRLCVATRGVTLFS